MSLKIPRSRKGVVNKAYGLLKLVEPVKQSEQNHWDLSAWFQKGIELLNAVHFVED